MTDSDLTTLVREHVTRDEPPFLLSPDTSIALGRRTLVRRRARRGLAGVLTAAAVVAAVPLLPWGGGPVDDPGGSVHPATADALEHYHASTMPEVLDRQTRAVLSRSVEDLGPADFTASDDQGQDLPAKHYDKASAMEVAYGGTSDHRWRVALMHARSEAEGDARKTCAEELSAGYAFSCTVTTSEAGDTVTTKVTAMRPLPRFGPGSWGALTRDELRTGVPGRGNPSKNPIDPEDVYFTRTVESVHSETFLTVAQEIVRAPDHATARELWQVPTQDLATLVSNPLLVIPEPPRGPNGCGWMLHPDGIACADQSS